jgi:hypothetical protein
MGLCALATASVVPYPSPETIESVSVASVGVEVSFRACLFHRSYQDRLLSIGRVEAPAR